MEHRRRRRLWLPLFGLLLAWQAWRLLLTPHGLAPTWTHAADLRTVSLAGAGVSQEFLMGADGLDGVRLRIAAPPPGAPPADGSLSIVVAVADDPHAAPIANQVVPAASLRPGVWMVPFDEVRASRGRLYRLTIQYLGPHAGAPLQLAARADDAHPAGRCSVDGLEQWGDLVFETRSDRATLPYWKDEILGAWPPWLRSWPSVVLLLLIGNLLIARSCIAALAGSDDPSPCPADRRPPVPAARAAVLTAAMVAGAGLVVAAWPVAPLRTLRFADHLADARIESAAPSLHAAVAVQPLASEGRAYRSIVALPPSRLVWTVAVPRGALLEGHAAMRADVWDREGDGVNLRVIIVDGAGARTEVAMFTLVPFQIWEHRGLHPFRVSLDPWSGQQVSVVFETDPERWGNAVNDVPVWIEPRIVWPRGRAWGEARIEGRQP